MEACLGELHGKPVMLELRDGVVYINGEAQPIKNLTPEEIKEFNDEINALPKSPDPGYEALVNAVRASFLARLLGKAVGDDCINTISHILDHVHYDVQKYLGEVEEE